MSERIIRVGAVSLISITLGAMVWALLFMGLTVALDSDLCLTAALGGLITTVTGLVIAGLIGVVQGFRWALSIPTVQRVKERTRKKTALRSGETLGLYR